FFSRSDCIPRRQIASWQMDHLTPSAGRIPSPRESFERELRPLRLTLQIVLVSLVIMGGSLGIFLFRQVTVLRRQVDATQRVAHQMVQHYNQNVRTQAMAFE